MQNKVQARLLTRGFHCGRYYRFEEGPFCYLNGNQFIKIIQDQITMKTTVKRCIVKVQSNSQLTFTHHQEMDLGQSDEIRIYKSIRVAKDKVGSKWIGHFCDNFNMMDRPYSPAPAYFHLTFDDKAKVWQGKWGSPIFHKKFWISQEAEVILLGNNTQENEQETNIPAENEQTKKESSKGVERWKFKLQKRQQELDFR